MGIFGKLFKGPEIDQAKSADSKQKMRRLFDSVVPDGGQYQLVAAYTEDAKRFNYGLVHGSKTTYGSLIVGWKEGADPTVVVVPTVPDLSGCGDPEICPRSAVKKAYQNKYPTDAFIIYRMGVTIWPSTPSSGWRMRSCSSTWTRDRKSRPLRLSSRPVTPRSEERVPCRFPWSRSVPSCWPW